MTAGRWVQQLIPEMKKLVQVNRQTVLFLKLHVDKSQVDIGRYFTWMCSIDGVEFYSLPGFEEDWIKIA